MKKLSLLVMLFVSITAVFAQKGKVSAAASYLQANDFETAKSSIDAALVHEKSIAWPKTYMVAANVYTALQKAGKDTLGLRKAVDFYYKAIELDKKGDEKGKGINKYEKELKIELTFFKPELINAGVEAFNAEKYGNALFSFENAALIDELDMFKSANAPADTVIIYHTALAAYNFKNWNKAAIYFDKAIDLNYGGGDAILLLNYVYEQLNDTVNIERNLKRGFMMYPEDNRIITNLIQYYLDNKKNDAALEYLNTAIEKDPKNASLFYARGVLYETSNKDKSIENYEASLVVDPSFFNSLYNIGVIYFNKGVEQQKVANEMTTSKKYDAAMVVANDYWKKSLPYMERAHEVKPTDSAVLETLKGLYYRFEDMAKYNVVKAKIEAL